jgi:ATP-dependent RNA helicase DDX19/DBP5
MLPKGIQIILFSATFPDTVIKYAQNFAPGANQMTLQHEDLTVEGIKQIYLDCEGDQAKYDALVKFYGLLTIGSSIIFVKVIPTDSCPPLPPANRFRLEKPHSQSNNA